MAELSAFKKVKLKKLIAKLKNFKKEMFWILWDFY